MFTAVREVRATLMSLLLRCSFVVLLFAFPLSMATANQPATPVTGEETRLYVSHGGRFTADIPSAWTPDYSLVNDYSGRGGFIGSTPISLSDPSITTLAKACELPATDPKFGADPAIETTTWHDEPACIVRSRTGTASSPVALAFAHPDPGAGAGNEFVAVTTSAAQFDAITASISFDPSKVTPAAYLDAAIDIIETHSIVRDRVDWTTVRHEAHELLGENAETGNYWRARQALALVVAWAGEDGHNRVIAPEVMANDPFAPKPYVGPSSGLDLDGVGYVAIPDFWGDDAQIEQFTDEMQAIIEEEAGDASCGWIVDLRGNPGGNMYPMIYGLASLLQPGAVIGFRDANNDEMAMIFQKDGSFSYAGMPITSLPTGTTPSDPVLSQQPLAVLVGPDTASAGEATALALAFRDQTRFFGAPTADAATVPYGFPLYDGAAMEVAVAWMLGPNGAIYPNGISPDVSVTSNTLLLMENDPAVVAAMDWLTQHPACDGDQATPMPAA